MFTLRIERSFFAAHALRLYDGSVEPLHAHAWGVVVEVAAEKLDAIEVVMDFHELERIVAEVLHPLQETSLNEHPAFAGVNPSAERVAEHIYNATVPRLPAGVRISRVTVTEAPGCRASYF